MERKEIIDSTELITVYSPRISKRLLYVLDWLLVDIFHTKYIITTNKEEINNLPFFISYGEFFEQAISIPDSELLWENNIHVTSFNIDNHHNIPTLFHLSGVYTLPFDLFSAIFFLISRYEEYYDYTPDKHGRYPATESILYKNGWLERPLIDEWVLEFYLLLKPIYPSATLPDFSFTPTYDIDIAYSFLHKGVKRTIGAISKDLISGKFENIAERLSVLMHKKTDPFDSFDWLKKLHKASGQSTIYFLLLALKTSPFDKNNYPLSPAMQQLIGDISATTSIGIHPSYYSFQKNVFEEEKQLLEKYTHQIVTKSRQHYVKMKLPDTYYTLIEKYICDDYSMGYGGTLGFRAGTGRSFYWYDLKGENATSLRIHPFCFMDSTAHFEEKLSATEAFEKLEKMKTVLSKTGSQLITVFHNFSLGTDTQWNGWKEQYERFLLNS